jgi:hypothetical protein
MNLPGVVIVALWLIVLAVSLMLGFGKVRGWALYEATLLVAPDLLFAFGGAFFGAILASDSGGWEYWAALIGAIAAVCVGAVFKGVAARRQLDNRASNS